jgi:hypothetical protein
MRSVLQLICSRSCPFEKTVACGVVYNLRERMRKMCMETYRKPFSAFECRLLKECGVMH